MAVALTTGWQTVATATSSYEYSGLHYYLTIELQAYYQDIDANRATIRLREKLSKSGDGWSGTNKHYRVRFYPDEGGTSDSGYNQDATTWAYGDVSYYLPDDWGGVYKTVNKGTNYSVLAYYLVDVRPSSEAEAWVEVYVPKAPSNPTISSVATTNTTFNCTLSTSSWGSASTGRFEYYFGLTNDTTSDYTFNPASGYTSNKSVSVSKTGLSANTNYYIRARVWNQQLNNPSGMITFGPYATLPQVPTMTVSNVGDTSVTIAYSLPADGGALAKNVQYSLDNGTTWVTASTINTGSATTGNFTITGLNRNATYTVKTRVSTTAGSTNGNDVTFKTKAPFYGSVADKTKTINLFYGSVNGKTKLIKKFYGSVNGKTKSIF